VLLQLVDAVEKLIFFADKTEKYASKALFLLEIEPKWP